MPADENVFATAMDLATAASFAFARHRWVRTWPNFLRRSSSGSATPVTLVTDPRTEASARVQKLATLHVEHSGDDVSRAPGSIAHDGSSRRGPQLSCTSGTSSAAQA